MRLITLSLILVLFALGVFHVAFRENETVMAIEPACPAQANSEELIVTALSEGGQKIALPVEYIHPYRRKRYRNRPLDGAILLFVDLPHFGPATRQLNDSPRDQDGRVLLREGPFEPEANVYILSETEMDLKDVPMSDIPGLARLDHISGGDVYFHREDGIVPLAIFCGPGFRRRVCRIQANHGSIGYNVSFDDSHLKDWERLRDGGAALVDCFTLSDE